MYQKNINDQYVEISRGTDLISPVSTVHDGRVGGNVYCQLYIRNDESTKWYSNIQIIPIDTVDAYPYGDVAYTETGWGVKLSAGAQEPSLAEWEDIAWGNTINMSNIGSASLADTTTYFPFWYMITCPPNELAKTKVDINLRVLRTNNSIT